VSRALSHFVTFNCAPAAAKAGFLLFDKSPFAAAANGFSQLSHVQKKKKCTARFSLNRICRQLDDLRPATPENSQLTIFSASEGVLINDHALIGELWVSENSFDAALLELK